MCEEGGLGRRLSVPGILGLMPSSLQFRFTLCTSLVATSTRRLATDGKTVICVLNLTDWCAKNSPTSILIPSHSSRCASANV